MYIGSQLRRRIAQEVYLLKRPDLVQTKDIPDMKDVLQLDGKSNAILAFDGQGSVSGKNSSQSIKYLLRASNPLEDASKVSADLSYSVPLYNMPQIFHAQLGGASSEREEDVSEAKEQLAGSQQTLSLLVNEKSENTASARAFLLKRNEATIPLAIALFRWSLWMGDTGRDALLEN